MLDILETIKSERMNHLVTQASQDLLNAICGKEKEIYSYAVIFVCLIIEPPS